MHFTLEDIVVRHIDTALLTKSRQCLCDDLLGIHYQEKASSDAHLKFLEDTD